MKKHSSCSISLLMWVCSGCISRVLVRSSLTCVEYRISSFKHLSSLSLLCLMLLRSCTPSLFSPSLCVNHEFHLTRWMTPSQLLVVFSTQYTQQLLVALSVCLFLIAWIFWHVGVPIQLCDWDTPKHAVGDVGLYMTPSQLLVVFTQKHVRDDLVADTLKGYSIQIWLAELHKPLW